MQGKWSFWKLKVQNKYCIYIYIYKNTVYIYIYIYIYSIQHDSIIRYSDMICLRQHGSYDQIQVDVLKHKCILP